MPPPPKYYKYRSIENWRFLLDIFVNNRLYAAPFADLNDPMEGQSYYANGHRGIAIGVELRRLMKGDIRRPVEYDSHVFVRPEEWKRSPAEVATTILFRKQSLWGHEDEFRVLTRRQHVAVKIVEVHLGSLMADTDRRLMTDVVKLAAPSARVLRVSHRALE